MPMKLEFKKLFTEKSSRVKCLDQHPSEPWILSSHYNGVITIWNYRTEKEINRFNVCDTAVRAAKFVARKKWVVTGSDDKQISIFNYNTDDKVHQFDAHSDYIRCIAVHPKKPCLLSSGDDFLIKLWNWEKKWVCQQIFKGHTDFVMQVTFNPHDNHIFASASLDTTIKVWQLSKSGPNFTLEGHKQGINCVAYYHGAKPYIVSGADDHLVKVWDYKNKKCVQTLESHTNNVTAVSFHPELPIIITGSEDGSVKIWQVGQNKLEYTLKYNLERVWTISTKQESNDVAIGYDQGLVMINIENEEPAISMNVSGLTIVWAKKLQLQQAHLKALKKGKNKEDGQSALVDGVKKINSFDIYPQLIAHSPTGRYISVCGNGDYAIYTVEDLKNKIVGRAEVFVWGFGSTDYAILENASTVKAFNNFQAIKTVNLENSASNIFGGFMLGVKPKKQKGAAFSFYNWENFDLIAKVEIQANQVYWSEDGSRLCLANDEMFYILRYNTDVAAQGKEENENIDENCPFEVINEEKEIVKSGLWFGDCFIYTNSLYNINYYIGGEVVNIAKAENPVYVIGYIEKEGRLVVSDKDFNFTAYFMDARVFKYQTEMLRGNYIAANQLYYAVPYNNRFRLAYFLENQGFKRMAMDLSPDPVQRFNIAISLGELTTARLLAEEATLAEGGPSKISEERWARLGVLASKYGEVELTKQCYKESHDYSSLLLLAVSSGDKQLLEEIVDKAAEKGDHNTAFMANFSLCKLNDCLDMLIVRHKLSESTYFAKSYLPSCLEVIVELEKELKKADKQKQESVIDPVECRDIYTEYLASIKSLMVQHVFGMDQQTLWSKILKQAIEKSRNVDPEEIEELERLGLYKPESG